MSDLASLMGIAPYAGSYLIGQKNAQERQSEGLRQQELMQIIAERTAASERANALSPHEIESKRLANQKTKYELPGIQAESAGKQLAYDGKKATYQSDVDAHLAKNDAEMFNRATSQFPVIAKELGNLSPLEHISGFETALKNRGFSDKFIQQTLGRIGQMKIPPGQLPKFLDLIGQQHLRSTPEYARTMDQEQEQSRAKKYETDSRANSSKYSADKMAERSAAGRVASDDFVGRAVAEAKGKPPATQFAILNRHIVMAAAAGDQQAVEALSAQAYAIKPQVDASINAPRAGTPDMSALTQGQVPTNPPANLPVAGPAPKVTPSKSIPPAAIEMLRKQPNTASQFDAIFGPGSAERILKGK